MVSPVIQKKKIHYNAASYNSSRETYSHFKILATARSYKDLKFSTKMSPQALGKNIPETCCAIYKVLKEYYKVRVYNVKNMINNLLLWAICNTVLLKFAQSKNRYII
jgi:hypothetical protein